MPSDPSAIYPAVARRLLAICGQTTFSGGAPERREACSAGAASLRRHDHANGTLMTRPSAKWKVINSSVTDTSFTLASVLTAVLTPCLPNPCQILLYGCANLIKLSR